MPKFDMLFSLLPNVGHTSGTTVRALRLLKALSLEFSILLVNRGKDGQVPIPGIQRYMVVPVDARLWPLKIAKPFLRNKFDKIFLCNDWIGFPTLFVLSRIFDCQIIFDVQDFMRYHSGSGFLGKLLEKLVAKKSDKLIVVNERLRNAFASLNDNIKIIPVTVDTELFKPRRNGRRNSRFKIGLIGPFDSYRNAKDLEYVSTKLSDFPSNADIYVIGHCTFSKEREKLIYTGHLSLERYIETLNEMDVVVVPSIVPTGGPLNKILESMACGKPVITTPNGLTGIDNVLPGEEIVVTNLDLMAATITRLTTQTNLLQEIGTRARECVLGNYSQKRIASELRAFITQ